MNRSNHKKALMLASVASMIDQFNIPNIQILQSLGYDVDVVADFENPGTITLERAENLKSRLNNMGVRVIHIAIPRSINPKAVISAYKYVKALIQTENYSLMHCHSPIGGAIARVAAKDARKHGMRVIYTAHGFHFYDGAPLKNWLIFYPVEKHLSRYTDLLITINQEDYKRAIDKFHAKKTVYVPGVGVDIEKFNVQIDRQKKREALGFNQDDLVFLSVGELSTRKNHEVVIKAIGLLERTGLKNIKYIICGKGNLEDYLIKLSNENSVNLILLGYRTDVSEICQASDLFLFPSLQEGLPVALMEAMSSGIPCIVSDIRGNRDLIDNEGGLLVGSTDIHGWSEAILRLISEDNSSFGVHNRGKMQNFSKEHVMEMMMKIYDVNLY